MGNFDMNRTKKSRAFTYRVKISTMSLILPLITELERTLHARLLFTSILLRLLVRPATNLPMRRRLHTLHPRIKRLRRLNLQVSLNVKSPNLSTLNLPGTILHTWQGDELFHLRL